MKVWESLVHSDINDTLKEKFIDKRVTAIFIIGLLKYFNEKSYGESVKEILYRSFCFAPDIKQPNEPFYIYGKGRKIIDCVINLDFDLALKLEVPELLRYIAKKYLDRSSDFSNLKIKDFDCNAYVTDLNNYFSENNII